jgi:hypothetical protein
LFVCSKVNHFFVLLPAIGQHRTRALSQNEKEDLKNPSFRKQNDSFLFYDYDSSNKMGSRSMDQFSAKKASPYQFRAKVLM